MPAPKKYPDELRERGVRLALESDERLLAAIKRVHADNYEAYGS